MREQRWKYAAREQYMRWGYIFLTTLIAAAWPTWMNAVASIVGAMAVFRHAAQVEERMFG